jgi:GH15 family glucan-1,4-alpha-glucosidase
VASLVQRRLGGEAAAECLVGLAFSGWKNSQPVRVGNGAWNQHQIDVYGELLGAAAQLSEHIDTLDEETRRFMIACAETAAGSWMDKDRGISEIRSEPQHFVYSKVMCWAALDRAIALSVLGRPRPSHCTVRPAAGLRPDRRLDAAAR